MSIKIFEAIRKYFSSVFRQSIPLLIAIGLALTARFSSESLHQSTELRLVADQGTSQRVDITSFCNIFKNIDVGVSLRFQLSLPRDSNDYLVFSTSQNDQRIEFWVNQDRQLFAVYKSFDWKMSEPISTRSLAQPALKQLVDSIDKTITLFPTNLSESNRLAVSIEGQILPLYEFKQVSCDNQGLIGVYINNSLTTITVSDQIPNASQVAQRSTVILRSLVSLLILIWFLIKWICRKPNAVDDHARE